MQNNEHVETVFHWSGENSERCRRKAGRRLHEHLDRVARQCEKRNQKLHVVAHSHGGSVLFEALQLDRKQSRQIAPSSTPIQRTLKTWVTVATPFLKFSVDWQTMVVPLLIFLSTAGVTLLRFEWFQQYWQQQSYGCSPGGIRRPPS
ncbi:MAG UNVERIFIED_CONTAM: hypothetical protein LVR18_44725 [Planctomycetaceae bacterium]